MSQAVVDPAELKRFANNLKHFSTELQSQMSLLRSQMMNLGQSWRDQEHEKFAEEFRQALKALKKFTETSKAHTPYLLRKAQRIEDYLNQR